MKKIGMIGLGAMGHSVAENIMKNGFIMRFFGKIKNLKFFRKKC